MTNSEKSSELFKRIVQEYEDGLKDAVYQFHEDVMAAQHTMEKLILKWTKDLEENEVIMDAKAKEKMDVNEEP